MNKTENVACEVIGKTPIKREDLLLRGTTTRGIYGLRNKITGKWYVGQSWDISERWRIYKNCRCKKQPRLYRSIKKYGWESFETYIIEEIVCPSQIRLDERETYWISKYGTIEKGYNCTTGGRAGKHTEESKLKIGKASKGRLHSEESKMRVRGKKHTSDAKIKMSIAKLGKPRQTKMTEEGKLRCRIAALKQHHGENWEKYL